MPRQRARARTRASIGRTPPTRARRSTRSSTRSAQIAEAFRVANMGSPDAENVQLFRALAVFEPNNDNHVNMKQRFEGAGHDPQLDEFRNVRSHAYSLFARALTEEAQANPRLAQMIHSTISEPYIQLDECRKFVQNLAAKHRSSTDNGDRTCTPEEFREAMSGYFSHMNDLAQRAAVSDSSDHRFAAGYGAALMLDMARHILLLHEARNPTCNLHADLLCQIIVGLVDFPNTSLLMPLQREMRQMSSALRSIQPPADVAEEMCDRIDARLNELLGGAQG